MMQLSIHYYVLSISNQTSKLYEGFRDKLIDIQNTKFPFESSIDDDCHVALSPNDARLNEFFHQTNQRFSHYYDQDPLRLLVVGEKSNLSIFKAVTTFRDIIIDMIEGDFTTTSPFALGKIVWPVVKEAIAGKNKNAMHDLATAVKVNKLVSGIEAVGESVELETNSTLYVEEDYQMRGSINKIDHSPILSSYVSILDVIDDVVDLIIENVLKRGGTVIFLKSGSLTKFDRIALILHG